MYGSRRGHPHDEAKLNICVGTSESKSKKNWEWYECGAATEEQEGKSRTSEHGEHHGEEKTMDGRLGPGELIESGEILQA